MVAESTFMGGANDGFASGEVKAACNNPDRKMILTYFGDEVVGVAVMKRDCRSWQIRLLLVGDKHRRKGLSQVLVDMMQIKFMAEKGGEHMIIDLPSCLSSESTRRFWVKNGCPELPPNGIKQKIGADGQAYSESWICMNMKSKSHESIRLSQELWVSLLLNT